MDDAVMDEPVIRAYLLGRISPDEPMSAQFDERMLTDPEFSLLIDVIEDEILEEYVDGVLSPADAEAVESHFLTPPERQRKLRRMRLISRHITGLAEESNTEQAEAKLQAGSSERGRVVIFPSVRTWAEIAAGLALVFSTIYFWNEQRELRVAVKDSRQETALLKQAQTGALTLTQSAAVTLNLVVPGLSRGDQGLLPNAYLTPNVETLHISIALTVRPAGLLSAQLKQGAAVVWSSEGLLARPVKGGAVLDVNLPAATVPEGTCQLIVNVPGQRETSYWFKTIKTR
jgi:hypothetical protein